MVKITITSFLGFPIKNGEISIFDTLSLFEGRTKKVKSKILSNNKNKDFQFNLKKGEYILRIESNKSLYERIISSSDVIHIRLPIFFSFFKKDLSIDKYIISNLADRSRWDRDFCHICKRRYKDAVNRFLCHYCDNFFCNTHRLPEHHKCSGHPISPFGGLREIHEGGRIIVLSE